MTVRTWAHKLYDRILQDYAAPPDSGEIVTADIREEFNGLCGYLAELSVKERRSPDG